MARTDTTQYATFHQWTFDRQSCECEEEPTTADGTNADGSYTDGNHWDKHDCTTKEAWSAAKRAWCCGEMHMGCDTHPNGEPASTDGNHWDGSATHPSREPASTDENEEVTCPDTSVEFKGMSVDEAYKACMARTDTTQYATFHQWTFDRQSCECEEEPTNADGSATDGTNADGSYTDG